MNGELYIQYNCESPIHGVYNKLKVKDIIDTIISHNETIRLWVEDEDDKHYSKQLWRGHAHQLPEEYGNYRFLSISGVCADSLYESDTININVCKEFTKNSTQDNNSACSVYELALLGCSRVPKAQTIEECKNCPFKDNMCNAYTLSKLICEKYRICGEK